MAITRSRYFLDCNESRFVYHFPSSTSSEKLCGHDGLKDRSGRACHFWPEQPSPFAPKQPNLKLSAQILSLLFADKPLVIRMPKDG